MYCFLHSYCTDIQSFTKNSFHRTIVIWRICTASSSKILQFKFWRSMTTLTWDLSSNILIKETFLFYSYSIFTLEMSLTDHRTYFVEKLIISQQCHMWYFAVGTTVHISQLLRKELVSMFRYSSSLTITVLPTSFPKKKIARPYRRTKNRNTL